MPANAGVPGGGGSVGGPALAAPGPLAPVAPVEVAAPPTGPAAPARVQVIAQEYSFTLSRPAVPAGEVILEFVNRGQDEHNLHAVEPSEGMEAGHLPATASGAHPTLTLDLHAGSYTLFCSLSDHEAKGMKADLDVN
jgi:plastocyanin